MSNHKYTDNLSSSRLRTRFLTQNDVTTWTSYFDDIKSLEFLQLLHKSSNVESSQFWIDRQLQRYAENKYGLQALIDKKTNEFIGQCGLLLQEVDGIAELEVGYHVFKKHWGKGYAPEAAKIFIEYAFKNKLAESVISIIDIRNTPSQRVADKNGLQREKQTRWRDMDVFIYRIFPHQLIG